MTRTAICPLGHKPDTDTPFVYLPHCIDNDKRRAWRFGLCRHVTVKSVGRRH